MTRNFYTRTSIKGDKYSIEDIVEKVYDISKLIGNARITHVGGNGRFKFTLNNRMYQSEFTRPICLDITTIENELTKEYYDYSDVVFDRAIVSDWSDLYIGHPNTDDYWKEI